jgi:hypothetical protein
MTMNLGSEEGPEIFLVWKIEGKIAKQETMTFA